MVDIQEYCILESSIFSIIVGSKLRINLCLRTKVQDDIFTLREERVLFIESRHKICLRLEYVVRK